MQYAHCTLYIKCRFVALSLVYLHVNTADTCYLVTLVNVCDWTACINRYSETPVPI